MKTWKRTWLEIQIALGKGRAFLYDATKKARRLSKDKNFEQDMTIEGHTGAGALNKLFSEFAHSWAEMDCVLTYYPKKTQWTKGNLLEMKRAALEINRKKLHKPHKKHKPHNHLVIKEIKQGAYRKQREIKLAFQSKEEELKAIIKEKDRIIREKDKEIQRLERLLSVLGSKKRVS